MTYDAYERSQFEGHPVEFHTLQRGTVAWRYTNVDATKTISGLDYVRTLVKRGKIEQSGMIEKNKLQLTLGYTPDTANFINQFIAAPPADKILYTLQRYHEGDGNLITPFKGKISRFSVNEREAKFDIESNFASLRRPVLTRCYQRSCPYALYDGLCRVDKNMFKTHTTLTAVSGNTLTSAAFGAFADNYFKGGLLEYFADGWVERRLITSHTGNNIVIGNAIIGIAAGLVVDAFPGCDRSVGTCRTKFGNQLNFGGFPWIPSKNPMAGADVF